MFLTGRDGAETDAAQPIVPPEQKILARPPARPGTPRPWEAGIEVATYSTANAVNRNLLTAIPLVSWGGVGPDVSLTLYHNSASVDSNCDLTAGLGADLGPGWTISYGGLVIDLAGEDCGPKLGEPTLAVPQIRVVACDGTLYIDYNEDGSYTRPAGVHTILNRLGDGYRLRYNYKSQDASIRHIGPMAQDFYAAFGVGRDEGFISTIDRDGVALAAIQGLHEIVKEKDAEIVALEARLAALEKLVKDAETAQGGGGR